MKTVVEIKHFHFFAGLGGGAKGFNKGEARVGNLEARFRCIGGIDVDPAGIADFSVLAGTVISASTTGNGAFCVADPRPKALNERRPAYMTGGHYGVVPWQDPSGAVPAYAKYDRGRWAVADPRDCEGEPAASLPSPNDKLICCIRALDGTWHRPFTTLELASLQGLADPEETLELAGLSDSDWRERIGNAVPPPAAQAVASVMGRTLLMAWSGQTFSLSSEPIWVQPIALALSVDPGVAS